MTPAAQLRADLKAQDEAAAHEAFKRINRFTDADVEALRRYTMRETDEMGWLPRR